MPDYETNGDQSIKERMIIRRAQVERMLEVFRDSDRLQEIIAIALDSAWLNGWNAAVSEAMKRGSK